MIKERKSSEYEQVSDSGISGSWDGSYTSGDLESAENITDSEKTPLLNRSKGSDHILYTMEKVLYYEQSRKQDKEVRRKKS